jgi:3-deoxy-D-manno-octulosonic-acid transferase
VILGAYRGLSTLAPPALKLLLKRRLARGKEDAARLGERMGVAARARPEGKLVWLHAASVGEALSTLPLIERVLARLPRAHVLVTSGTVTSARIMAERLPARAFHQFVPLDAAPWVARFLDHWRPDLALWIESELWPNLLRQTAARGIPIALVNARMTERSFRGWKRWPGAARDVLGAFRLVLAQSETYAERFRALGAAEVSAAGNLKYAAPPLPADEAKLAALRAAIGTRRVWLAASIHPGEEEPVAEAQSLLKRAGGALGIVVPRHPPKGAAMAEAIRARGLTVAVRSAGALPEADTAVYVADTLGELGLFYRVASLALVGGSLIPHGGQNPIEPALFGVPVLHGPHVENFADVIRALTHAGAAFAVKDGRSIAACLENLLPRPHELTAMGEAAKRCAEAERGVIDRVMAALEALLAPLAAPRTEGRDAAA